MFKQAVDMSIGGSKNPKDAGYSKLVDLLQSKARNSAMSQPEEYMYPSVNTEKPSVNPVWAQMLYKGVEKRDKLKEGLETIEDDPSLVLKGLLGKSLLDKHINPFFDRIMPDSTKLDVLKKQIKFNPHDRFGMTLGDKKLGLNWRF